MAVIGVDPGKYGAIVMLPDNKRRNPEVYRMPMSGLERGNDYDIQRIIDILSQYEEAVPLLVIEHVTRPASIVRCRAIFETIGLIYGWPTTTVSPAKWKRAAGLGTDKQDSINLAVERLPWLAKSGLVTRKKDDGIAEAALIALWGRENVSGVH